MGQEWNRRTRSCAELDGSCAMKEEQLSLKPTGELFASSCSFGETWRRLLLSLPVRMVAIENPDLPWAQEAALQQRWFGCGASVRDSVRSEDHQARHLGRTIHRQSHVFPAVNLTTRNRSQKLVHQVGTRLAQGSAQGWHKVEVGQAGQLPISGCWGCFRVLPKWLKTCRRM